MAPETQVPFSTSQQYELILVPMGIVTANASHNILLCARVNNPFPYGVSESYLCRMTRLAKWHGFIR